MKDFISSATFIARLCAPESAARPQLVVDPIPKNRKVLEVRDEDQVLIAHNDQVPVLVRADPTIKAPVDIGNALVSCTVISVGVMRVRSWRRELVSRTPYTYKNAVRSTLS